VGVKSDVDFPNNARSAGSGKRNKGGLVERRKGPLQGKKRLQQRGDSESYRDKDRKRQIGRSGGGPGRRMTKIKQAVLRLY